MHSLQTQLIYKYSFASTPFIENDLLLDWDLSEKVLITAYDLLKQDYLVTELSRTGSTLKEYLQDKGLTKDIKIVADTGIFEFEAIKAHMDIDLFESVPHEFSTEDIFTAYELINPDYLISPDSMILQSDTITEAQTKVSTMIELFNKTIDRFNDSKDKIIPVIQGFDEPLMNQLFEVYSQENCIIVARGGLIPLWFESKPKFEEVVKTTQLISNDYGIAHIHSFGLPSLTTLKTYFVDNSYASLDTSLIYYRTAQRQYLTNKGYFISVNKAHFKSCGCKGCLTMLISRLHTTSSKFIVGLYYHNCQLLNQLVVKQLSTPEQVFSTKSNYYGKKKDNFKLGPELQTNISLQQASTMIPAERLVVYLQKQKKLSKEYKILVIQNCTKRKKLTKDPLSLFELQSHDQRQELLSSDRPKVIARNLYLTKDMNDTVDYLRTKGFLVDYYFLSAGFGLVSENTPLPAYDCTFMGKTNEFLDKRAKELLIVESIAQFGTYDLIYVTASENYLYTLDLHKLGEKCSELVYFNAHTDLRNSILSVNAQELYELDRRHTMLPIELSRSPKERLVYNYGLYKANFPDRNMKTFIQAILETKTIFRAY